MVGTNWGEDGRGVAIGGSFAGGLGGVGVVKRGERRGRACLTPPASGDGRRGEIIGNGSKFPPPLISRSGGGREEEEEAASVSFLPPELSGSVPCGSDTSRALVKHSPEISLKGRTTVVEDFVRELSLLAARLVQPSGDT